MRRLSLESWAVQGDNIGSKRWISIQLITQERFLQPLKIPSNWSRAIKRIRKDSSNPAFLSASQNLLNLKAVLICSLPPWGLYLQHWHERHKTREHLCTSHLGLYKLLCFCKRTTSGQIHLYIFQWTKIIKYFQRLQVFSLHFSLLMIRVLVRDAQYKDWTLFQSYHPV